MLDAFKSADMELGNRAVVSSPARIAVPGVAVSRSKPRGTQHSQDAAVESTSTFEEGSFFRLNPLIAAGVARGRRSLVALCPFGRKSRRLEPGDTQPGRDADRHSGPATELCPGPVTVSVVDVAPSLPVSQQSSMRVDHGSDTVSTGQAKSSSASLRTRLRAALLSAASSAAAISNADAAAGGVARVADGPFVVVAESAFSEDDVVQTNPLHVCQCGGAVGVHSTGVAKTGTSTLRSSEQATSSQRHLISRKDSAGRIESTALACPTPVQPTMAPRDSRCSDSNRVMGAPVKAAAATVKNATVGDSLEDDTTARAVAALHRAFNAGKSTGNRPSDPSSGQDDRVRTPASRDSYRGGFAAVVLAAAVAEAPGESVDSKPSWARAATARGFRATARVAMWSIDYNSFEAAFLVSSV